MDTNPRPAGLFPLRDFWGCGLRWSGVGGGGVGLSVVGVGVGCGDSCL